MALWMSPKPAGRQQQGCVPLLSSKFQKEGSGSRAGIGRSVGGRWQQKRYGTLLAWRRISARASAGKDSAEAAEVELGAHESASAQSIFSAGGQTEIFSQTMASNPEPPMPPWRATGFLEEGSGWAIALGILVASRIGRQQFSTEAARLPTATEWAFQQSQRRALSANPEILVRQRDFEAVNAVKRKAQAAQSLEKARKKEAVEKQAREERESKYRVEADRETARLRVELEAQKKAFQEKEAAMAAELAGRVEKEKAIMEEQAAKRRAEREAQRLEEEEEKRRLAEARAAEAEKKRQELEDARKKAREEAAALKKLSKAFALSLETSLIVSPAEKGALVEGPLQKEAVIKVQAQSTSALGGTGEGYQMLFANIEDAKTGAATVAGAAARSAADAYISAVRLQDMMGQGALQTMDDLELQHWMRQSVYRAEAKARKQLEDMLKTFSSRKTATTEQSFVVRTQRRVVPSGNPKGCRDLLEAAIAKVEAGAAGDLGTGDPDDEETGPTGATRILLRMMRDEEAEMADGGCPVSVHGGEALVLAHFTDRMLNMRPSKTSDAPVWFEEGVALSRRLLTAAVRGAPQDSLTPMASGLRSALPEDHPMSSFANDLAVRNLSPTTRAMLEERQRIMEAELQRQLFEEEWPDRDELAAARMEEVEANTPIPERCWALRNVAGSLSSGGPGERARARSMLERAVSLKEEFYKSKIHPGLLAELEAFTDLLGRDPSLSEEAVANRERILEIANVVALRYARDGQMLEAAVLQAGAAAEYAVYLGPDHPGVLAMQESAEKIMSDLDGEDLKQAMGRLQGGASVTKQLAKEFTEQLAAYKQGKKSKAELWDISR